MIRVLLVDDQQLVRAGLRMIVESDTEFTVVGEASNGQEAIDTVARSRPDVILMDIRMPVLDGVEATRRISGQADAPPVLILTTFDTDDLVFAALRAGASGFVLKDTPPEQLLDDIRVVVNGDSAVTPSITRRLIEQFAQNTPPPISPAIAELTDREMDVLKLVARGMSNSEIAEALFLGEATVKTHLGRVLAKLGLRDRVQIAVFAYEHGLVVAGRTDPTRDDPPK